VGGQNLTAFTLYSLYSKSLFNQLDSFLVFVVIDKEEGTGLIS
jgi:hypothetical protein